MTKTTLSVLPAASIDCRPPEENWLIRYLWAMEAVGICGGIPKLGKSWLGLDMAISIASGTACLGRFEVEQPGPTLVFMAEDSLSSVRARIEGICRNRNLDIQNLQLNVITEPSLRLDLERDQKRLRATGPKSSVATIWGQILESGPIVKFRKANWW